MTWKVLLRPRAEADVQEARDWYEAHQGGLGEAFIDEVSAAMNRLEADPERHADYYRGVRRLFLTRFPYKVFYLVEADAVIVLRVLHARQDHVRHLRRI